MFPTYTITSRKLFLPFVFTRSFATLHAAADSGGQSNAARRGLVTVALVCATFGELPVVDIGWPDKRLPMIYSFRQLRLVHKTLSGVSWIYFLGLRPAGRGSSVSLMTQPPCERSGRDHRIDTACE